VEDARTLTRLLTDWSQGDPAALEQLTPLVYRELHALARSYLNRSGKITLQPTELINEAYIRLMVPSQPLSWENRAHFFGIAARLMRLAIVDHVRERGAAKRGSGAGAVTLDEGLAISGDRTPDVLEIDEALTKLAEVDQRMAKGIELRYFGGLSQDEIATILGISLATVKRDLRFAESWLRRFLSGQEK
jgi:RNA polymerase sigma factor (TIGR02999 family)